MPKHTKVSDQELVRMIEDEIVQVRTESFDLISDQRIDSNYSFANLITTTTEPMTNMSAVKFYFTPQVVQTLVMHGSKVFCSNKNTVEFSSPSPDPMTREAAKQLSMMVNHVIHNENDGFEIITELLRSAAVNKNGVAKTTWDEYKDMFEETYTDIDEVTLQQIVFERESQGYDVDVTELESTEVESLQAVTDEMGNIAEVAVATKVGDYSLKLSKIKGRIAIDVLPPEEFVINEDTTSIHNDHLTRFVGHKREVLRSDIKVLLERLGSKVDIDYLTDHEALGEDYERRARHDVDGTLESFQESDVQIGPSSKLLLVESLIRADRDGDGYAEWIRVFTVGNTLLHDEPWYGPLPYTSYTYFPIPHKNYGLSVYDRLRSYEETATGLVRSDVDGARLQNVKRWLVREGSVDTKELESGKPGPIEVSNTTKIAEDVVPIQTAPNSSETVAILQELRRQVIGEVGIDPITGQISTDVEKSGNDAAKTSMVLDNASVKMEGYHRRFAEGPLRDISWSIAMELVRNKDSEFVQGVVNAVTPGIPFIAGQMDFMNTIRKADLKSKVGLGHQTGHQRISASQATSAMLGQLQQNPSEAMYKLISESLMGFGYEQPEEILGPLEYWQAEKQKMEQMAQANLQMQGQQIQLQQQQIMGDLQIKQQESQFNMKLNQAETLAKIGKIEAETGKIAGEARKAMAEAEAAVQAVAGGFSETKLNVVV